MSQSPTLYERLGGEQRLPAIVTEFYDRVLADPVLAPVFADASRDHLHKMMGEFLSVALDGPIHYTGRDLAEAHHALDITPDHLTRFVNHLRETLAGSLSEADVLEVITRINMRSDAIVERSNVDG